MTAIVPPAVLVDLLRDGDDRALDHASRPFDWGAICSSAEHHGVAPLLYRRLRRDAIRDVVPGEVMDELQARAAAIAARNMLFARELGAILRSAAERGIPCAPLRGLALAERLYGDIGARPIGDLDVLVRRGDLSRLVALLADLGFDEVDRRHGFARAFSYTLELVKQGHGGVIVEPHWTLAYPPFVDAITMDEVWAQCRPGRAVGVDTLLLGSMDVLLNLCLHLAHKAPEIPLLWLLDIDRLVRQEAETIDWCAFVARVRDRNLGALVGGALDQVCRYFGTPIPDDVRHELMVTPSHPRQRGMHRLLASASGVDGKESLALFFVLPGVRARCRYALGLLFPSPCFMKLQYELTRPHQLGLAYVRRVGRLSWEGLKGTARLFF